MADENNNATAAAAHYQSPPETAAPKRKYEDTAATATSPLPRRTTGFSSPDPAASYNSVPPPPMDAIEIAKQRAQEIAARIYNTAEAKRPKFENGGGGDEVKSFVSDVAQKPTIAQPLSLPSSYGYGTPTPTTKKIEIPNGRVGVIIGKGGETIKNLQMHSNAKIQVTRDSDADPNCPTRAVELTGDPDAIAKAEQMIHDVIAQAETGGSGTMSRGVTGQPGGKFSMKIPNNKVGLIIGKGGETIKNMQHSTGARIQVIPLHLPPGDPATDRTLYIDGTSEQIEAAKEMVNDVISENRQRNSMAGGYSQQSYQSRPPTNWATPTQTMQQQSYGYVQPTAYPGQTGQYAQTPYAAYPPQQASGGYATGWDQSAQAQPTQQTTQGAGAYDYYNQQQAPQAQAPSGGPTDNSGYYTQQGQAYTQEAYAGYPPQQGYGQPQAGYDQNQGYANPTPGYSVPPQSSDGQTTYAAPQGDKASQPPAPVQSSATPPVYGQHPSPNPSYPPHGTVQQGYGVQPGGYAAYGGPGYGQPTQQPPAVPPAYGQQQQPPQQSPTAAQGGYAQPQQGYSQPGYGQPDSVAQRAPPSGYGAYAQSPYGAPPVAQPGYGAQQPPAYNSPYGGGGYSQPPPVYSTDATPAPQAPQPGTTAAKASPQS